MEENELDPERNEIDHEFSEECWDGHSTANGDDPPSDPDCDEIENFGTGSEAEQFLQNNEEAQGYEDLQTSTDVAVFKIFAKEQIARGRNGKQGNFRQFNKKSTGDTNGGIIFGKCKSSRGF